jgi:hypothetical protein
MAKCSIAGCGAGQQLEFLCGTYSTSDAIETAQNFHKSGVFFIQLTSCLGRGILRRQFESIKNE